MEAVITELREELDAIKQGEFQINEMDNILARCRGIMSAVFGAHSKQMGIVEGAFLPRNSFQNIDDDGWVKNCAISGLGQTIAYLKGEQDALRISEAKRALNSVVKTVDVKKQKSVFLIHGHADEVRESVARFIEKIGLDPIILFERPNGGKTIIEKFEKEADVGFAIALLTADDTAICKRDQKEEIRARQNVVFEMGYFVAKLGRDRVAVLKESGVAEPSDLHGIVYTELDSKGAWKFELAKELKAAGFDIDMNKVI